MKGYVKKSDLVPHGWKATVIAKNFSFQTWGHETMMSAKNMARLIARRLEMNLEIKWEKD